MTVDARDDGARPGSKNVVPVAQARAAAPHVNARACVIAQRREKLDQVQSLLAVAPDDDFNLTKPRQDLIAVPIPFKGGNHEPDLSFVGSAARMIASVLATRNSAALESTSSVGATKQMAARLAAGRFDISYPQNPGVAYAAHVMPVDYPHFNGRTHPAGLVVDNLSVCLTQRNGAE